VIGECFGGVNVERRAVLFGERCDGNALTTEPAIDVTKIVHARGYAKATRKGKGERKGEWLLYAAVTIYLFAAFVVFPGGDLVRGELIEQRLQALFHFAMRNFLLLQAGLLPGLLDLFERL